MTISLSLYPPVHRQKWCPNDTSITQSSTSNQPEETAYIVTATQTGRAVTAMSE